VAKLEEIGQFDVATAIRSQDKPLTTNLLDVVVIAHTKREILEKIRVIKKIRGQRREEGVSRYPLKPPKGKSRTAGLALTPLPPPAKL
jgi:predicted Zn-ribbon and HTH transcriptional regulator